MMENDFFAILSTHAPLIALIPAARMFPIIYPQGAASPALRYEKITGRPGLHMTGSDGLTSSLMQVDMRVKVVDGQGAYGTALLIRNILIGEHGTGGLLHPYRGVKGSTYFDLISLRDDRGVKHETTGSERFYTASLDFDVWSRAN